MYRSIYSMEVIKWLATIGLNALVHILHVPVTENAASACYITAGAGKCRAASFPRRAKRPMTGQLKISTGIIKKEGNFTDEPSYQMAHLF